MRKKLISEPAKQVLKLILTLAILGSILYIIKPATLYSELKLLDLKWLLLAILITPFTVLFRAVRLQRFIYSFAKKVSLAMAYNVTLIGMFFGFITPARAGDFVKIYYIHKSAKLNLKKSLAAALFDRVYDIFVLILLAILGLGIFSSFYKEGTAWFAIFIILLALTPFFNILLNYLLRFLPTFKYLKKHAAFLKTYNIHYKTNAYGILSTVCIWLSLTLQAFLIFKAMHLPLAWTIPLAIVPLMALSNFIPVTISGIGLREYITAVFLPIVGISIEKSVVFSLIYTFAGLVLPAIVGAVIYLRVKSK